MKIKIRDIEIRPFNIPLKEAFNITLGSSDVSQNVLIKVILENGIIGYGEGADSSYITGDLQGTMLASLNFLKAGLVGQEINSWKQLILAAKKELSFNPAVFWALETALLDAYTQVLGIPLYEFLGGAQTEVETDITISITAPERARELAKEGREKGFNFFKIKVGKNLEEDLERVRAVAETVPESFLRIDANQGYHPKQAVSFIKQLWQEGLRITLFEQPVHWGDIDGLKYVREYSPVPVAADETVFTARHALQVIKAGAVDVINIKLAKSGGILEALDIIAIAKNSGVELMIGCMLESNVGLAPSVHLACGTGAFSYLDLDAHLLLAKLPLAGGFSTKGPILSVAGIQAGMGIKE